MFSRYFHRRLYSMAVGWLYLLSLLLLCNPLAAQVPGMRKYTQLDGYTATVGYEINQDEKGYIWLGTDNGGMNFDGKVFRQAQNTGNGSDAEILFCRPVGADRILLLPMTSTPTYLDKGKLVTAAEDTFLRGIKLPFNRCLQDPVTGKWWLHHTSVDILYSFNGRDRERFFINNRRRPAFNFSRIINNKLIGDELLNNKGPRNLLLYDMKRGIFLDLKDSTGCKRVNAQEAITNMGSRADQIVTLGGNRIRVYHYDTASHILKPQLCVQVDVSHAFIYTAPLLLDRNDGLWLRADQGISYYGAVANTRGSLPPLHLQEPALVSSVFVDRNNNVWISAPDNALYFLSAHHFENERLTNGWPHKHWIPKAIAGDNTGCICISYANHTELSCINGNRQTEIRLDKRSFAQGSTHILALGAGKFIVYNSGIALVDVARQRVSYLDLIDLVKNVSLSPDSSLITATPHGVFQFRIGEKESRFEKIFDQRSTTAVMLANGHLLIGTPDGLYEKSERYVPARRLQHPVLSKSNITVLETIKGKGTLIGTNTQGLFVLPDNAAAIKKIEPGGSVKVDFIRRLYQQDDSTCWIATDNGAFSVVFNRDWSVRSTHRYTIYDGLPSDNISDVYVQRDTAYFTTTKGLGIIPLRDSSRFRMAPPGIYINEVQTDQAIFRAPDTAISLPYDQNNLLLSLSAISYESLGNTAFFYQLSPLHDEWIQTTNTEVRFTALPPGDYTFRVYAVNAKGGKSRQPLALKINIKPAFWQTIYFKAALLLLGAAVLYFILRRSIRRSERNKFEAMQQKKRLAELELEAIKAQINPHFIYNCLNSIKYLNYTGAYKQTQEYLGIFARLIRLTMQYSRRTFISLDEEMEYLSNYLQLEHLRFKDKLDYELNIEQGLSRNMLLPAMLLQPYVENALKHGIGAREKGGKISILFRAEQDQLEIQIRDNGSGFTNPGRPDSLGLHLAGTRALSYNELFNLNIKVTCYNVQDQEPGQTGAVVSITFKTIKHGPLIQ
jgi:ligand-binding sensor domain-containing protein